MLKVYEKDIRGKGENSIVQDVSFQMKESETEG